MDKLISEQVVLDVINKAIRLGRFYYGKERTIEEIKAIPSAEPKTGHWEWLPYDYNSKLGDWCCSKCRSVVMECVKKDEKGGIPLYKYCPQCGRKIQEAEDGRDSAESEE